MKDKRLAKENPQIHLILGGGGEANRAVNERVNEVSIYRLEPRGGYLGRIDYSISYRPEETDKIHDFPGAR